MKKYFEVLQKCPLFSQIENENIVALLGCLRAKVVSYGKKENIMTEGERARYIGIVLSGSAQVERVDYFGNRSIVSGIRPSELFGESFAFAGVSEIPVNVVANEDSEIMLIDCARIMQSCNNACEFHRQMIYNMMKDIASKNLLFHQKIEITSKRTTREKLLTYLMLQAKKAGNNSFDVPFDRQELADYLEVDRSGLSAEIGKLRREGIINSRKNHFEIL